MHEQRSGLMVRQAHHEEIVAKPVLILSLSKDEVYQPMAPRRATGTRALP
jgi:hypothetical protein